MNANATGDPEVTVTMPLSSWKALLSVEPMHDETYTGPGIALFNAYQPIHHAVAKAEGRS